MSASLHDELVARATKWLLNSKNSTFAIPELRTSAMEYPDVFGYVSGYTVLVEVKTSRSDFTADAKKYFRRVPRAGMGALRYYFCPPDLINVDELPPHWGLCYCHPKHVKIIKEAEYQERDFLSEQAFLVSALRRCSAHVNFTDFTAKGVTGE